MSFPNQPRQPQMPGMPQMPRQQFQTPKLPPFAPQRGMMGTAIQTPQPFSGGHAALIAGKYGAQSVNAPANFSRRNDLRMSADQQGVVSGAQQMPTGGEMTQAQRDQAGAAQGPQNAALAGWMMG